MLRLSQKKVRAYKENNVYHLLDLLPIGGPAIRVEDVCNQISVHGNEIPTCRQEWLSTCIENINGALRPALDSE